MWCLHQIHPADNRTELCSYLGWSVSIPQSLCLGTNGWYFRGCYSTVGRLGGPQVSPRVVLWIEIEGKHLRWSLWVPVAFTTGWFYTNFFTRWVSGTSNPGKSLRWKGDDCSHLRIDRDKHVKILWENIEMGREDQFARWFLDTQTTQVWLERHQNIETQVPGTHLASLWPWFNHALWRISLFIEWSTNHRVIC